MQTTTRTPKAARVSKRASNFEVVAHLSDARVGVLRSHIRMRMRLADCEQAPNITRYEDAAAKLAEAVAEWQKASRLWLALAEQFPTQHAQLTGVYLTWRNGDGNAIGGGTY